MIGNVLTHYPWRACPEGRLAEAWIRSGATVGTTDHVLASTPETRWKRLGVTPEGLHSWLLFAMPDFADHFAEMTGRDLTAIDCYNALYRQFHSADLPGFDPATGTRFVSVRVPAEASLKGMEEVEVAQRD